VPVLIAARVGVYEGEESRFVPGGNPMKKTFEQISQLLDGCTRTAFQLTRREMFRKALAGGAAITAGSLLGVGKEAHASHDDGEGDVATSLVPAAAGGPEPSDRHALSVRWLGCSCFELVYRHQVILLDAWYDRPLCRDIGLIPEQVTRANVILVGHAHFDHIADAASIAQRTGAIVIADRIGTGVLASLGLPSSQYRTVNGLGGEVFRFPGFTVEVILAHHSVGPTGVNPEGETASQEIIDAYLALMTFPPEDLAAAQAVTLRGSFDPLILTEGTMAYLLTLDSGYRVMWLDSGGPITDTLVAVMERERRTNLAMVGYQVQVVPRFQVPVTLALAQLFNPDLLLPAHHDELISSIDGVSPILAPDMATEPLFIAMRDAMPRTQTFSSIYRTPIVINTRNGDFVSGSLRSSRRHED